MKIYLHGVLKERYGPVFEIKTDRVHDAIEGLSRQLPDWPRDLLIEAVGFETEEKLRSPSDACEVHLLPAMFGGKGIAKFIGIIIGAAMVVAGILLLPTNPALGWSLIASGATMILAGVVQLFMKAPTVSKANDPPASKFLGVNKNTTDIGTPIILAWGRVPIAGHWLSIQADSNKLVLGVFPETPT